MTGDAPDPPEDRADADGTDKPPAAKARGGGTVEIELEVSRQRNIVWAVFGTIVGALLIWKLGTVGVWAGVALVAVGAFRAFQLVQSFVNPPGTIVVTEYEVVLPRGLSMSRPVKVAPKDVTAVYFLRRSVPWNRSAPVLIVELGARAMAFPRDWFASEADQRHVIHALLRGRDEAA
jgi:hypothetical protein